MEILGCELEGENNNYTWRMRKGYHRGITKGFVDYEPEGSSVRHQRFLQCAGKSMSPRSLRKLRASCTKSLDGEFSGSASHQLSLMTSLPFVHTTRRYRHEAP